MFANDFISMIAIVLHLIHFVFLIQVGMTVLATAAQYGHTLIVKLLLTAGADPNIKCNVEMNHLLK